MDLWDFQDAAVGSKFQYFKKKTGNPIVALPTGTGKSLVIAEFIRRVFYFYPNSRVMVITHVKELISQNHERLVEHWPNAPAGVYSAGLGKKDIGFPILFGGIQTVANANPELFGRVDLLLIDECHLLSPNEDTQYRTFIAAMSFRNPYLKVVGYTATKYRMGQGQLIEPGGIFTDICFDMTTKDSFNWLIDHGYLVMLNPKKTSVELDVSSVHLSGGEYKPGELQKATDKPAITRAALEESMDLGGNRHHWLIFATGVDHTVHITEMLLEMGISATCVHSDKKRMTDKQRDTNIADYKSGKYLAMVNNGILTTGFDFPAVDFLIILRPTQSTALWVQINGRGTRPLWTPGYDLSTPSGRFSSIAASSKQDCLVADFARNSFRLGPINDPVLPKKKGAKGSGDAPVKVCQHCMTINHASARVCFSCKMEFIMAVKLEASSSTAPLVDRGEPLTLPIEIFKVDKVTYLEHRKAGMPNSISISYYCGLRIFKEWMCLEHTGIAKHKARDMWRSRSKLGKDAPETLAEAFTRLQELRVPTHIKVLLKGNHDDVIAHDYSGSGFNASS